MAQPSSLNTNNPFRRKQAGAGASTPSNPPLPLASDAFADAFDPLPTSSSSSLDPTRPALPSSDDFRNSLQSLGQSTNEPPPKTSFQKPKVVKKVRVQSPPPSPESEEEEPVRYPPVEEDTAESSSSDDDEEDGGADPFARASETYPPIEPRQELPGSSRVPPNPFGRTLEDLEHPTTESTQSPGAAQPGGKGSLDVDSFRRLLLTGQAGGPVQSTLRTDGASITDASSTLTAQDTPRTSHEISEHEREESQSQRAPARPALQTPSSSRSKAPPPPPPSSRHGKLIKSESSKGEERSAGAPGTPRPSSSSDRTSKILASPFSEQPSDMNKPLPAQPVRSPGEEDLESPFDREAAGKVPEETSNAPTPRPPTPPKPTTATPPPPSQVPPKKPPPPPRRSTHGRSESKVSVPGSSVSATPVATPQPSRLDEEPTRTSVDSIRSRSSSMKVTSSTAHVNAPAPPPPRRSTHGSRPSTSTAGLGMGVSSPASASVGGEGTSEFPGLAPQPISGSAQSSRPTTPANNSNNNPSETASITSFSQSAASGHGRTPSGSVGRLAPPPPPPARNKSVRSSGAPSTPGGAVRRTDSGRTKGEPIGLASPAPISTSSPNHAPPPPPRPRGSNRRSVSGSGSVGEPVVVATAPGIVEQPKPVHPPPPVPDFGGGAGARFLEASLALGEDQPRSVPDGELTVADSGMDEEEMLRRESAAKDILADLDALQREVDALRAAQEQGRV
ncbi:hypothetical protein B0T20DRAFT_425670 [Sordaria brevicollis]|uniref:Uncharacterized protein n=1 Tax=Sordaria brevicollis TaxID=83679 RepID=A0AAE0NW47_SORBR|nr:hypothetical protein B0T20DRAFT_425670 [Sordaria brevicollis]